MHFSACTLLAPYLHQFSAVVQFMHFIQCCLGQICSTFGANLATKLRIIDAETAPSSGAI